MTSKVPRKNIYFPSRIFHFTYLLAIQILLIYFNILFSFSCNEKFNQLLGLNTSCTWCFFFQKCFYSKLFFCVSIEWPDSHVCFLLSYSSDRETLKKLKLIYFLEDFSLPSTFRMNFSWKDSF